MKHFYKLAVAAAMVFTVSTAQAQPCGSAFYDGFESGSYTPTWTQGSAPITFTVGSTAPTPASGNFRLQGTGANSTHLLGLMASFTAATPSTISWDMYPNGSLACNYVVGGDATMAAANCVFFCYVTGGTMRFVSSVTYIHTATVLNQWMHVEMRNINWTARTFDIYVNNVLAYTAFPFRTTTQNTISRIHLYNFNAGSSGYWDNIAIGGNPITLTNTSTNVSCNGGTNGTIDLSVSGGTSPYTYAWSNSATTQDLTGIAAGTYSVVITDAIGCHDTLSNIVITEPAAITSTIVPTNVTCFGSNNGGLDLTASGGVGSFSYLWSSAASTEDISGVGPATYTVIITDGNGCTHVDSASVTEPPLLLSTSMGTDVMCFGDSSGTAMAMPTGGSPAYSYLWSNGQTTQTATGLIAGSYTYTVTDVNGCTTNGSATVNQPPALSLNMTSASLMCYGDSSGTATAIGSGGSLGYQYLWNTGATTSTISGLAAGVYYCTVTDSNSCSFMDSVTVSQPTMLVPVLTSFGILCNGDSTGTVGVSATGGTPAYTYLWSTGDTSAFVGNLPAGAYSCTVTDANGCVMSASVALTEPAGMSVSAVATNTSTCGGSDGSIDLTVTGGTPGYTFAWSNGDTAEDIDSLMAGSYTVIVTDANGCTAGTSADVNDPPSPTVSLLFVDADLCVNDGPFSLNGGSPAGGTWSGTAVTGSSFSPSTAGVGNHLITYTYTDNNGCTGTATDTLLVDPCVGIQEQSGEMAVSLFPNPTSGQITLSFEHSEPVRVDVFNAMGELIDNFMMNGTTVQIDFSAQPVGMYFVQLRTESGVVVKKVIRD